MRGSIDEIGVWNRALTPDEITQLFNAGDGMKYPFNAPAPSSVSCVIFVHGSLASDAGKEATFDFVNEWVVGRDYWQSYYTTSELLFDKPASVSSNEDFIRVATDGFARPFFVVRYNGAAPYWSTQAAGLVARQMALAIDGLPDAGGNSCNTRDGNKATRFWVVSHSMGGTVMDYILGNSLADTEPGYDL
jgi:hypothetical protein